MSAFPASSSPEACGTVLGTISLTAGAPAFDPLTERSRETWSAADFGRIAVGFSRGAEAFVERLSLARGETVLDVACGTGNLAIPAARRGARVTGIDIAANLIEAAWQASVAESIDISFDVGNAEALPYGEARFETVISMFGVMFAARPDRALAELLRVTKRGGRIVLANWTSTGFVASMLRAHAALVPPPTGTPSVLAWGDESAMSERLEVHASRIRSVRFTPRTIALAYPLTPGGVVELFREFYGPSLRTFKALDAQRRAALTADLLQLWSSRNAEQNGHTSVDAEYLEVQIDLA
ncbi:MAG: class I SAM-dependent methyltransferase [Acidobacteriota bacterium]